MQTDEEAFASIKKIAERKKTGNILKQPVAGRISDEYLETQIQEEVQINLEEVKNGFVAGSNNLFDFVMNFNFSKAVSFDERVTIYCQMVSLYDNFFEITEQVDEKNMVEFAMVFPK